ncbi:unnamed protein product [Rotaria sp. Silwood2]|nr:unnamed protein product [Rotaria sp. Silwood2]CAF4147503.1 unnamed protein product [Rotaria sp. Silwood2]
MDGMSNNVNNETNESSQSSPPPPYNSVVYKKDENEFNRIQSSTHFDVNNQSFVDFDNYPGPPLTDGYIHVDQNNLSINHNNIISKKIHIYLIVNGIITIIFGFISIAIQISIIKLHLITYYYYGFWGGLFLVVIGLCTMAHHHGMDNSKIFHSFLLQSVCVGILFAIGIIIILTDTCTDNTAENDNGNHLCSHSYKVLNGFLLSTFAIIFLQSIMNGIIFFILRKQPSSI